jgi:hypothetical protein
MTIKYHGTPFTPKSVLETLKGKSFCVSFAHPQNINQLLNGGVASKVMLDSGAFTAWRKGGKVEWSKYYAWTEKWLRFSNSWAVIGDVINGSEEDNGRLIREWPHGDRGAPVWHLHESIEKLQTLCRDWPLVCIGSSGQYAHIGKPNWIKRMQEAFDNIALPNGELPTKLHMLRGLRLVKGYPYPFHSVDSATIARNYRRDCSRRAGRSPASMVAAWEVHHTPTRWCRGW